MDRNSKFSAQNYDDTIYGIDTIKEGHRVAYLYNVKTATIVDEDLIERTALSLYLIEPNGNMIHAYLKFPPYFYVTCNEDLIKEMMVFLEKKFEKRMASVELVEKVDLDMTNYLSGKLKKYIKLNFRTINDLMFVRNIIRTKVEQTKKKVDDFSFNNLLDDKTKRPDDMMDSILEMREFDVPYHIRVCIDKNLRIAFWYSVTFKDNYIDEIEILPDKTGRPELHILAFDIETTKLPMKFPDARYDQIMMISYVIDGKGYLITNRQIISADIQNFEYTPKPEFECRIKVYNEPNEAAVIDRFFAHIRKVKPLIIVSYNGDFFDWPFVEARAKVHNLSMHQLTGISVTNEQYYGRYVTHMDCMCWVNRDSYLPQGSRGLKNVTKHKLGYNPIELDPEMMLPLAQEDPQLLSQYSVSDSIATYYLYMKHIHDFIFALCTIIPTFPDEVLRAGSGTLCENLLMAEAFKRNIIFPNKKKEEFEKFFKGHLLNSETYIGGKVECINSGVYREDLPTRFRLEPEAYHHLMKETDKILEFILQNELAMNINEITNYDDVKAAIVDKLQTLSEVPANFDCQPLIYHLDVAAMYPNIILTNRLQPTAIVNDKLCSGCLFNRPESNCKRNLNWEWKGEYFPLTRNEYEQVKVQIEYEHLKNSESEKSFYELPQEEQHLILKKRVKEMSQKAYRQVYQTKIEMKENTVCMRANSFYVDTIRDFRDRRYEFKNLVKVWKNKQAEYEKQDNTVGVQEAKEMAIMYESLQLAHKIILNSFYGYVMRRGARWYSMEMAAMVTHVGSNIISDARGLIDKIGKPLELDTDGIWCLLPKGFPENFSFSTTGGKKVKFSFPCSMLNLLIHEKYANPQYQTLVDQKTLKYDIKKEMSVFFEVDGPYKAMVIPAAREEGKVLKKRYVVYHMDGSIAEIKGFELKRRGELKIIKIFQEDLFNHFLAGKSLEECYMSCGAIAERWLDILDKRGEGVTDEELLEYIGESKMLSKNIAEYDKQKGVALTAAKRMAEILGSEILQGRGLNCFFIVSHKPVGKPVSERVIPTMIFNAEEATKRRFLNKWLQDGNMTDTNMRSIIDWEYYKDRLGNSIQKVITIPAALQKVKNPCPRVPYPDWLHKLVRDYDLKFEQKKINSFFHKPSSQMAIENEVTDMEDILPNPKSSTKKSTIKSFLNLGKNSQASGRDSVGKGLVISQRVASDSQFLVGSSQDATASVPRDVFFDMNTEFDNWLKWQKGLWRARRKGDNSSKRKSDPKNSIGNMFRSHEEQVVNSVWHVLQICETDTPGIYKLWIYLESSQIFSIKVKARRNFYVNSLVKTDIDSYKLVKKRLPRNKKAFYLYETVLDEEDFVNTFHSFDELLTNPDYEGAYETKIPLDFKIICDVGSVVRFNRNKSKHYNGYASYTFDVDELKQIYERTYLTDFNIPILVISQISMKGKMIWCLFNNNLGEFNFFIVEKNHVPNNYKKIVKDILKENNEEAQDMVFKISVNSYEKDEIVMTHIEQYLQQLKDRNRNTPYIIVLQTQYKIPRLNQLGLKSIMNSYPTLHLPAVDSSEISFSSLDWQLKGIRHLTYQYLNMNEYLDELLGLCKYSNIPFCNLGHDRLNFVTDVVYARILKKANCLSWYSMTGVPETGGGKMDDARELIPTDFIPSEVINPNLYTDFCVEIDIELLARNAICASDELKSLESENSTAVDFTTLEEPKVNAEGPKTGDERRAGDDLDETVVSRAAFHLVKVMADIWNLDVVNHSNEYADRLLGNLQRWVCDEESRFYDVMLHKMLNILMKKVYGYLLQRLKNLGAKIVYASPSKIIISTGKYIFHEAENYSQFILRTVISYPIFADLNLSPKKYWKILLLKDRFNYGGIVEDEEKKIDFSWNVSEYLPPQLGRQLLVTLADYINKISKFIEKILQDDICEPGARLEEFHEKVSSISKRYVSEVLSYHLFESIPRLNDYFKEYQIRAAELKEQQLQEAKRKEARNDEDEERHSQQSNEDSFEEEYDQDKNAEIKEWEFPQVLGRIPEYKNGVLELIKFLSHILAYDENIQDETTIMKRNCLKLLGMSDFAEDAKYIEPCKKFILTDVVCKGCSNVLEVDVFRDKIFKEKDFNCHVCGMKFDERRLETKIIKLLKQYVIFYQIQDLYCSKCKMAKSELLDQLCKCSGKYVMREDTPAHGFKTEQKQLIRSFEELANHCDFPLLRDYLLELKFEHSLSI